MSDLELIYVSFNLFAISAAFGAGIITGDIIKMIWKSI